MSVGRGALKRGYGGDYLYLHLYDYKCHLSRITLHDSIICLLLYMKLAPWALWL